MSHLKFHKISFQWQWQWQWMTMKITLLPCNTWSILSNGITLTGYIQNQSIVYKKKEKYMAKGTRSRSVCVPISLEIYLYEGAIGTEQCKCNGINYHFISFASQVIAILNYEKKNTIVSCYNNKRGNKTWTLMWGNNHVYQNSSRQ